MKTFSILLTKSNTKNNTLKVIPVFYWPVFFLSFKVFTTAYFFKAAHIIFSFLISGAKRVYIGGQLIYSVGMIIMAAARHPAAVILLSPTAGVMYSTLFTMPYLLIAHYHCMQKVSTRTTHSFDSKNVLQYRQKGKT